MWLMFKVDTGKMRAAVVSLPGEDASSRRTTSTSFSLDFVDLC
jgi:hypothetical protein